MAKEYIEREAFLADLTKRYCEPCEAEGKDHDHVRCRACWVDDMMGEIGDAPFAADVVEVVRPDEAVLAEFENDYKDFKKIKTHLAQIIVEGKVEEPYYSILWWDEESKEYNIGYSSYCLDYVRKWLELVFEVVDTADVVEVVRCKDCRRSRPLRRHDRLENRYGDGCVWCMEHDDGMYEEGFCSDGERRDNNADG